MSTEINQINYTCGKLEPQWDNEKSYLQLRKEMIVAFEDDMPNMKTKMNHNLLKHKIERASA